MDREHEYIVKALKDKSVYDAVNNRVNNCIKNTNRYLKSAEKSEKFRTEGNSIMTTRNHDRKVHKSIWIAYTKSIAAAPNDSRELITAYSNRSVLLFHMRRYEECLKDVNRALKINNAPKNLIVKFYCRKIMCLISLNKGGDIDLCFKLIERNLQEIDDENIKSSLKQHIDKAKDYVIKKKYDNSGKQKRYRANLTEKNVKIASTEDDGKHLIAPRDIEPGEIICVEKYYVASVDPYCLHTYCSHCLAFSFANIPCLRCSENMYCSEECRIQAWTLYHEAECSLLSTMEFTERVAERYSQVTLRAILKAIKEAGGIQDLQKELESFDQGQRNNSERENNFLNLYDLSYILSEGNMKIWSKIAIINSVLLGHCTNILGKKYDFDNMNEIVKDSNAIFFCKLFLKISMIMKNNHSIVRDIMLKCDDGPQCISNGCLTEAKEIRGIAIAPISALIKHSCFSNLRKVFTGDGKVVYFSIKPIRKNSVLTDAHFGYYTEYYKVNRCHEHREKFNKDCTCIACSENWPRLNVPTFMGKNYLPPLVSKIMDISHGIDDTYEDDYKQYEKGKVLEVAKKISPLFKRNQLTNNTFEQNTIVNIITMILDRMYGIHAKIPGDCLLV